MRISKKRRKDKFRKKALFNAKHNLHWKQHVRLKQKDFLNQPLPGKSQYSMLESDSSAVTQRKKDAHESTPPTMRDLTEEDLEELRIQNQKRLELTKLPGSKSVELLIAQQSKGE